VFYRSVFIEKLSYISEVFVKGILVEGRDMKQKLSDRISDWLNYCRWQSSGHGVWGVGLERVYTGSRVRIPLGHGCLSLVFLRYLDLCRYRPCDELLPRPRSSTVCRALIKTPLGLPYAPQGVTGSVRAYIQITIDGLECIRVTAHLKAVVSTKPVTVLVYISCELQPCMWIRC
jgi:hypothetical protein